MRPRAVRYAVVLVGVVLVVAGPCLAAAQTLDDLRTPTMPAFTVLGIAPIAIERPSTPTALGLGLLSAAGQGGLPENYAIEVAPYWLTPKPLLPFAERYRPTLWQGIKQSFALSMATAPVVDASIDSVRFGAGFRVLLLPGRPGDEAGLAKDSLNEIQGAINDLDRELDAADSDSLRQAIEARIDSLLVVSGRLARNVARLDRESRLGGVRWELAGGVGTVLPQGRVEGGRVANAAVWSSLAFRPGSSRTDFVALLRFQHLDLGALPAGADATALEGRQGVVDVGVRLLRAVGSFELSAELLGRLALDVTRRGPGSAEIQYDNTYRAAAALKYVLSENVAIRWALGRGFALEGADAHNLIADLALELGLGPTLDLPW